MTDYHTKDHQISSDVRGSAQQLVLDFKGVYERWTCMLYMIQCASYGTKNYWKLLWESRFEECRKTSERTITCHY